MKLNNVATPWTGGISCLSRTCITVRRGAIDRWSDSRLSALRVTWTFPRFLTYLTSMSCPSEAACTAVGVAGDYGEGPVEASGPM